jgi:hypothetical protein
MSDTHEPDLTAERGRQHEAASAGIESRAAFLDIDTDDRALETAVSADAEDDELVEDADVGPVDATV